jgi:hypothetical protein
MKRCKLALGIAVWLGIVVILVSCNYVPISSSEVVNSLPQHKVVDFGNGVYCFSYSHLQFGSELANFINEHPKLEVVSFSCIEESGSDGCIVVFRQKKDIAN